MLKLIDCCLELRSVNLLVFLGDEGEPYKDNNRYMLLEILQIRVEGWMKLIHYRLELRVV